MSYEQQDDDRQPAQPGGLMDQINTELDHPDQAVVEASTAVNDSLTDDQDLDDDGEVTLPGTYADCVWTGVEFSVRITNRERVLWDRTARKHQWGPAEESQREALTFMAWQASKRDGVAAGALTFDQFVEQVEEVEGRVVARVRPTR